ncbi:zinc-dependent metalloprotease [Flavobacterium sp.]
MKKITLALLLLSSFFVTAQRTCGMEETMNNLMADPVQKEAYLKMQRNFEVELQKLENNPQLRTNQQSAVAVVRIPVAVHYPSVPNTTAATLKTCLIALAQTQINILNADYNAQNADLTNWTNNASAFYPNTLNGSFNVEFVLATQNHPAGYGLVEGQPAVTFGYNFGAGIPSNQPMRDANFAGYLNFVVKNIGSGLLGYAPLGGSPNLGHAVAINTFCFATGAQCSPTYKPTYPYNLGRTVTHELGHYFNLNHTFGSCGTNCLTSGDKICDTPAVLNESYENPEPGTVAGCVPDEYALTMNYMDYVDDRGMYMFTQGQGTRMLAHYNNISSQFNMTTLANNSFIKNNYSLAPNPNNGTFTLTFKDLSNDISVEVFDISGRSVFEKNYSQNSNLSQEVKIDSPSSGIYFVNVKSGGAISTEKIIIR